MDQFAVVLDTSTPRCSQRTGSETDKKHDGVGLRDHVVVTTFTAVRTTAAAAGRRGVRVADWLSVELNPRADCSNQIKTDRGLTLQL